MCPLWVKANENGAAKGYRLEAEPDPFAIDDDAWKPTEAGIDPFEQPEAGEPSSGQQDELDPFAMGGDEELPSRRGSMKDPEPEPEIDQLTLGGVPDVPPAVPLKRSRVAGAVKGGRGRGRGRRPPQSSPELPPRTIATPLVQDPPSVPLTPAPFAGTVELQDVERLEALGLEVDVDGWADKPIRLVAEGAKGETDEGFEMSLRDGAAVANILHAFPGARITAITTKHPKPEKGK